MKTIECSECHMLISSSKDDDLCYKCEENKKLKEDLSKFKELSTMFKYAVEHTQNFLEFYNYMSDITYGKSIDDLKKNLKMNSAEKAINDLMYKKSEIQKISSEMEDIESMLNGLEITYKGRKGVIDWANGSKMRASIYLEDADGNCEDITVTLKELLTIVAK